MNTREVAQQYRLNKWIELIRKCRSSGQTISVWCAEHNIKESSYFYWLKRVRKAACEALPSLKTGDDSIVPINIPPIRAAGGSARQETSAAIVVRFGTVLLEIQNNASPALIENTLRALQYVR